MSRLVGQCFSLFVSGRRCLVWILGHSFVYWGARRAEVRPAARQLGLPWEAGSVRWIGVRGMMWNRVVPKVHRFARWERAPDIMVIHAWGNDLGVRRSRELIRDIRFDFLRLRCDFLGTILIWSEIVARTVWREARSVDRINKARVKVNKEVGRFFVRNNGLVIRHQELEAETWRFLRGDGVHLNAVGTDLLFLGLEDGVQRAFWVWRSAQV